MECASAGARLKQKQRRRLGSNLSLGDTAQQEEGHEGEATNAGLGRAGIGPFTTLETCAGVPCMFLSTQQLHRQE